MDEKILVTYASKYGATAEIAEKIGQALKQDGTQVDVLPVKRVNSLTPYKAIILGSALYIGAWRKEAVKFLQVHEHELAKKPFWIFSSGPTGKGNPVELLQGKRIPDALQPLVNRIQPRDITVFHGNVDESKLNFIEKWMIAKVKAPAGDFRDWEAITTWAEGIAEGL